jgi:hypothetical protein
MGFTLIARTLIDRVYEHMIEVHETGRRQYFKYKDGAHTRVAPCAFMLHVTEDDMLLGEDASFCWRAAHVGAQPWLYVGEGSQLGHVGSRVYR